MGTSITVPVCRDTLPLLINDPLCAPLLRALWTPEQLAALSATVDESEVYYAIALAYTSWNPEATRAALMRDWFGLYARGGMYLCTVSLPGWRRLLEAAGFQRVESARPDLWDLDGAGYVLDLRHRGVDGWIDSLIDNAGDELPPPAKVVAASDPDAAA